MNKGSKSIGVILTGIFICIFVVYMCLTFKPVQKQVHNYYQVYLGGTKIGLIKSKEELNQKINDEQQDIKDKYKVDNVYSPQSLEVQKVATYKTNLMTVDEVYDEIKDLDPFTIEGYEVVITPKDKNESKKRVYILHKEDLDVAVRNTVLAFVDEETYDAYLAGTQKVVDEGIEISAIYFDSDVSIKKTYVSTEENIITNEDDLSQYFLFGTTEIKKKYKVKASDTLESIADKNRLGVSDLLVANPGLGGENALLAVGQELNVSAIEPLSNIVVESFETEYQTIKYDTIIEFSKSLGTESKVIKQSGSNGTSKVTFATKSMNGVALSSAQVSSETIVEAQDRIVVYGSKGATYVGNTTYWAWPTVKPYKITSKYGWRVHPIRGEEHFHSGVDIAGTKSKNIFAIQSGTVTAAVNSGYNNGQGKYIKINHGNGYVSIYMHLKKVGVKKGDHVDKGQVIGIMGCTGSCTGTHLHFGLYKKGELVSPLSIYK